MDVIAALAVALGAFDAEHVELGFDVAEDKINPELVRQAKGLRRRSPKGHQRSLRDVAAELAKLGLRRGFLLIQIDSGSARGGA